MPHFIKTNRSEFNDSLIQEANGLELLRTQIKRYQIQHLNIPKVHSVTASKLVIEKIHSHRATSKQMNELGKGLALLHKVTHNQFGLAQSNYIGLSTQVNVFSDNWGEFFVNQRLGYQVGLIKDDTIKSKFQAGLENYKYPLIEFLNKTCGHASLVHGDLWSGNVLFDQSRVWLIDPAVYYADREVDLAMTQMFAGFDEAFYQGYEEILPLTCAYSKKKIIYNLYHYLNHYNLFGAGYLAGCLNGFEFLSGIRSFL